MALWVTSLILVFAAVCRATVNLTEQQLRVCQGHDAILANCSTVGTGGLVWLFSGQADVRFQPSTIPTIGTTLERMNQGSNGSVFTFTLDDFDNETDTYRSTANVSNIQLSDNATSITCAEPTPQNPISIVVIVLKVCPSPSSTIIPAITSTLAIPDRSTTDFLSLSIASPTVSPVVEPRVNLVVILVPIVFVLLLLVVIATVMVIVLLVRNKRRTKSSTISTENGHFEATDNKSDIFYDCQSLPENSENQDMKSQGQQQPPPTPPPSIPTPTETDDIGDILNSYDRDDNQDVPQYSDTSRVPMKDNSCYASTSI